MALRRSIGAGGHRAFAPALQTMVSLLAVVSMPLSIAALAALYSGDATVGPQEVAIQVFKAQLLPLGLGMLRDHLDLSSSLRQRHGRSKREARSISSEAPKALP